MISKCSSLYPLFSVLCSIVVTSALWLEEEEEPINLRAFRVMPNKRKRSLPMDYADDSVILESRFRRRANELFG
ncbi:hypothetical protein CAEBREN_16217 [Caenorhabditis brenneri]|uniref:Uncharacterized protein n=1 Tax=Caenorhabditis brenneri TaxID=135651 RepID=G0MRH5_CAEBE|nr:hypothetical protein CAEBREN_16217 [Caenorhabditis brenneri]